MAEEILSKKQLLELRKITQEKLAFQLSLLGYTVESLSSKHCNDTDLMKAHEDDSMVLNTITDVQAIEVGRSTKIVKSLTAALHRLANGSYTNICRVTGDTIPFERLKAVPHTTVSKKGQILEEDRKTHIAHTAMVSATV